MPGHNTAGLNLKKELKEMINYDQMIAKLPKSEKKCKTCHFYELVWTCRLIAGYEEFKHPEETCSAWTKKGSYPEKLND